MLLPILSYHGQTLQRCSTVISGLAAAECVWFINNNLRWLFAVVCWLFCHFPSLSFLHFFTLSIYQLILTNMEYNDNDDNDINNEYNQTQGMDIDDDERMQVEDEEEEEEPVTQEDAWAVIRCVCVCVC